ncbi:MAG: FAD-binding oxidoreductase [Vicinamibacterales bacterium]
MVATALEPLDAAMAARMLADAAREARQIVPAGSGTKMRGMPIAPDALPLSSARLVTGLAHYAGDLVATVPAGARLHDVNAALATQRQWLPLDPPFAAEATIGGIVAANDSGPRRQRYGAPRDLIIGIEVALTNGTVVHAGGRVVKNVAGYDLARLFCGSRGSLGMITSVTFKLAPMPHASCTVVARFGSAADAVSAALQLAASPLTPSTIELSSPEPSLLVRFESTAGATERMAEAAAAILAPASRDVAKVAGEAEARLWREYDEGRGAEGLTLQIALLPTASATVLNAIERAAAEHGVSSKVVGRAALGVFRVAADGTSESLIAFATAVRAAVHDVRGHLQVAGARDALAPQVAALADGSGSAAAVGEAVKLRFDPAGILPYPWPRASRG